jgi:2-dehydro-3-deoxyphosphogluconate aldolase/(4S)-4-hydroxy-2-oxoglutarate aldolase
MIPREMISLMARHRLVAEVQTDTAVHALGVVEALADAGIHTMEISLAIPGAHEILGHLATRQDILVGAGSVVDVQQARDAVAFGARFIASPILNIELIHACREKNVTCIPGALTPSEIIAAQRAGAEMVKLFPGEAFGGPDYVRAVLRQLTHVSLQVSGGISAESMLEFLEMPIKTLALGNVLIPPQLVERENWPALTNRARAFVEFVANPHQYAARFLAMVGIAPRPKPAPAPQPAPVPAPQASSPANPKPAARVSGDTEGWLR